MSRVKKVQEALLDLDQEFSLAAQCALIKISASLSSWLLNNTPLAWIGSGLSRIAAEFGCRLSHRNLKCAATSFTPLEYCGSPNTSYLPILLTFGGKNIDSLSVAEHIVREGITRAILITGSKDTPCETILREGGVEVELILAPSHKKDQRFLAMTPLILTCAAAHCLTTLHQEPATFVEELNKAREEIKVLQSSIIKRFTEIKNWRERRWIVLGGGLTYVAAVAWQVLLSESALSDVLIADMKDYTHARYLSALQRQDIAYLVLADQSCLNLAQIIVKRFSKLYPTVLVKTSGTEEQAFWSHLGIAAASVSELCVGANWNIMAPPKPSFFGHWSNWGKIAIT